MKRSNLAFRLTILTVLVLTAARAVPGRPKAQESSEQPREDGAWWAGFSRAEKVGYVLGRLDGEISVLRRECEKILEFTPAEAEALKRQGTHLPQSTIVTTHPGSCLENKFSALRIPKNYTMGQFADGIDQFYADYRNRMLEVSDIAEEVEKQLSGASDDEINRDLEKDRKWAQR